MAAIWGGKKRVRPTGVPPRHRGSPVMAPAWHTQGGRGGCARGGRLIASPLAPQADPNPAAQGTHLQGGDAGSHATHHVCVRLDVFQNLVKTTLQGQQGR